ncbi:MAG TPA: hypothetical protein HA346_01415, partial [Thermoplasmata archaeon]|nr:hypothetical protein [Thermoplasmata archaeon]
MKAVDRGWFEYEWRNSGEKDYYLKGKVVDYFESFDIHFSVTMKMDEFTAPTKVIRDTFLAATVTSGWGKCSNPFACRREVAKPFVSLSETSNKIIKGDLEKLAQTARADAVTPIKEFSMVSKDINLMVNSLQNKIEELEKRETEQANAIKSFSEILGKVMRG